MFCRLFCFEIFKKIGYVATKNLFNSSCDYCIFICPGLSGFAIPFIEWFFDLYNTNTALVSLDYRGFGLSGYQQEVNEIYNGININTMATDMYNLFTLLKLQKKRRYLF